VNAKRRNESSVSREPENSVKSPFSSCVNNRDTHTDEISMEVTARKPTSMNGNRATRLGDPIHFKGMTETPTPTQRAVTDMSKRKNQLSCSFSPLSRVEASCHTTPSENPSLSKRALNSLTQRTNKRTPHNHAVIPFPPLRSRARRDSVLGWNSNEQVAVVTHASTRLKCCVLLAKVSW
jgi:hypothetical protein